MEIDTTFLEIVPDLHMYFGASPVIFLDRGFDEDSFEFLFKNRITPCVDEYFRLIQLPRSEKRVEALLRDLHDFVVELCQEFGNQKFWYNVASCYFKHKDLYIALIPFPVCVHEIMKDYYWIEKEYILW